jgi:hypothetical protein
MSVITDTQAACDWCGVPLEGEIVTLTIRDQRHELCCDLSGLGQWW